MSTLRRWLLTGVLLILFSAWVRYRYSGDPSSTPSFVGDPVLVVIIVGVVTFLFFRRVRANRDSAMWRPVAQPRVSSRSAVAKSAAILFASVVIDALCYWIEFRGTPGEATADHRVPFALIVGYVCAAALVMLRIQWTNASERLYKTCAAIALACALCFSIAGAVAYGTSPRLPQNMALDIVLTLAGPAVVTFFWVINRRKA